jgi:nitrate/nitrite-specific signal transduction histidine kinase
VDVYQEKEIPRHLEDIKKVVVQLDQLSENLEKSKEDAMVSRRYVAGLLQAGIFITLVHLLSYYDTDH